MVGVPVLLSWLALLVVDPAAPLAQPPNPAAATRASDLRALHEFASCVALGRPDRVRRLLVLDPAAEDTSRQFTRLIEQSNLCTSGRLGGGSLLFRGALAEALIRRDLGGRTLAAATAFTLGRTPLRAFEVSDYIAMCLVRTQPGEVAALLATSAGSSDERRAFARLQGHLADCIPQGQSATVNRHGIRAAVAVAAYRLVAQNQTSLSASSERQ